MKKLLENFRTYLTEAPFSDYNKGGKVVLYHYADPYSLENQYGTRDPEKFTLDTSNFGKSYFSRNEMEASSVPRVFFYVNLDDVEKIVVGGRILYSTEVPASEIYDLKTDPEGYIKKIKHPDYGLRKGVEYNELLEFIRDETPYKGIFYGRSFDVVSWLEPIEIYKVETEEK